MSIVVAALAALQPSPEESAGREPAPVVEPAAEPGPEERAPAAFPRTRVIVGVPVRDPSIVREELTEVLAGHFADTGLRPRVASITGDGDPSTRLAWASTYSRERDVLAVFWIEGDGEERSLYLFEPREGATWTRSLPASTPEELLESLGAMLRGISLFLESGPPPGMEAVEPPEPVPVEPPPPEIEFPPPPPRPPPSRARWGLELAYAGGSLSDQAPWQSGGGIDVDVEHPAHVVGTVGVALVSPARLRALPETTVWRVPLSLGVGYRFRPDAALRPMVDAALVVEPTWWRAKSTPEVDARSGSTVRLAVAPGVGLRWRAAGSFGFVLHLRADLRVMDADLVVSQGGTRVPRLTPHRAAAFARAGLYYTF